MSAPLPHTANAELHDSAQTDRFLSMLFGNVDWQPGQVTSILGIGEKGTAQDGVFRQRHIVAPASMGAMHAHVRRWSQWHVAAFIVPAVLTPSAAQRGEARLDDVAALTAIILDLDSGDVNAKAKYIIDRLGKPTMLVASGGKTETGQPKGHLFWRFSEPCEDVERVAAIRKLLAAKVGGDQSFGRATQVVRIPGSVHAKNGVASLCRIIAENAVEYSFEDLAEIVEDMEPMPGIELAAPSIQLPQLTLVGGMDFTPRQDTAIAALHRDVAAGGDELTRWGEFSKVAGFHIAEARAGRITPPEAYSKTYGWMLTHMVPPWPPERFEQEFRGLFNKDVATHGPFPQAPVLEYQPLNLWPIMNKPEAPPEFPVDVLGPVWSKWVIGQAEAAGAPVAYVAVSLIVAAAGLNGNARRVSHGDWVEPSILWTMLVGNPSAGKTPAIRPIQAILSAFDRDIQAGFPAEEEAHQAKEAIAKLAKDQWEKAVKQALAKGDAAPPMPNEARMPEAPVCPAVVVQDVTPEKLGYLSNASPKGLMMLRDELAGWLGNMNRYSGGGERQTWLEAYNGDATKIDRVKLNSSIHINNLSVNVLGGIQPDRLNAIMRDDPDDGLIPRFLFAFPDPVPPRRATRFAPDFDVIEAMRRLYSLRLALVEDTLRPVNWPLTDDAGDRFEQWRLDHHEESKSAEGMAAGSWGKMPGQLLRLALVLELLNWISCPALPEPATVGLASLSGAIELIETFFKPMAKRVLGSAGGSPKIHATKLLATYIVERRLTLLETRPIMSGKDCPTLLRKSDYMDPACAELVDAGWLKPVTVRAGGTKGRLPKAFEVSHELWNAIDALHDDVAT